MKKEKKVSPPPFPEEPDFEPTSPISTEAEQGVLGAILREPSRFFQVAHLQPEHFSLERHRTLFEVLNEAVQKGEVLDLLTAKTALEARGLLKRVGGDEYLQSLVNGVPNPEHVEAYAKLVAHAYVRREMVATGRELVELGYTRGDLGAEELVVQAQERVSQLAVPGGSQGLSLRRALEEFGPTLDGYLQGERETWGLATRLRRLDDRTGGLEPGQLWVVAGDPGAGKSAFVLQVLLNVAEQAVPAVLFSLEMTRAQVLLRLVANVADLEETEIKRGRLSERDKEQLRQATDRLKEMPLTIFDGPASTLDVRAALARMRHPAPKVVGLDYTMLLGDKAENEVLRIASISTACKNLAVEFATTVLLIHPIDSAPAREHRPPRLNELAWGRRLQYDADLVLGLSLDGGVKQGRRGALSVLKQRHGGVTGDLPMWFEGGKARWQDG